MTDLATLKAEVRKLSAQATQARMDLHDLSEELPQGIDQVMATAARVCQAYAALDAKRAEIRAMDSGIE